MNPDIGFAVSQKLRSPTEFVILPGDHHVYCDSPALYIKLLKDKILYLFLSQIRVSNNFS
jgi:hypothetical protein